MKNLSYKRNTTDKLTIKGRLSDDFTGFIYETDDGEEFISFDKTFSPFVDMEIALTVVVKSDEDLEENIEKETDI